MSETLYQHFKKQGYNFFVGVPCSEIKGFVKELESDIGYIPATREDEAIAIAVGAYFTGKKPLVFMQNTGLAMSCNAILSLLKPYGIDLHLMVTQHCNAPHHKYVAESLKKLLKAMDYTNYTIVQNEAILK